MDLNAILKVAEVNMKDRKSQPFRELGNKFYHGLRVAESAKHLCEMLSYETDLDILTVAAWFHDICNGVGNHEYLGANKTVELLDGLCTKSELDEIWELITYHDSRSKPDLRMEIQILQDADRLDHYGISEVWDAFQYALSQNMSMEQAVEILAENDRIHEADVDRNSLRFPCSRQIYDEKMAFFKSIINRMRVEGSGGFLPFD